MRRERTRPRGPLLGRSGRRGAGRPSPSFGKKSKAISAPKANPPMWAQYATPPVLTWPSAPTPLNSWRTNHIPSTTTDGSETNAMMKKKISVRTCLRGNITR